MTSPKTTPSRSEEIVRKHKEFIWPAVTNYYREPLVADHAAMQYVWDLEGNKYLDFFGGILTIGVGHCNPKVGSKIKAQVDKLQHTSTVQATTSLHCATPTRAHRRSPKGSRARRRGAKPASSAWAYRTL